MYQKKIEEYLNIQKYLNFFLNKICIGIFLDIKKAFDSLDRSILLNKLRCHGIYDNELQWFESYPANRKQFNCDA